MNVEYLLLGKNSPIKCKQEASEPRLIEFVEVLEKFWGVTRNSVPIQVVTDDSRIQEEISRISKKDIEIMNPEPAPIRIPDKVRNWRRLSIKKLINTCS